MNPAREFRKKFRAAQKRREAYEDRRDEWMDGGTEYVEHECEWGPWEEFSWDETPAWRRNCRFCELQERTIVLLAERTQQQDSGLVLEGLHQSRPASHQ